MRTLKDGFGFRNQIAFMGRGDKPHAQPPTWRTSDYHLVWPLPFDLSAKLGPAGGYPDGKALKVTEACKLPHHDKALENLTRYYSDYFIPLCFVTICNHIAGEFFKTDGGT